MENHLKSIQDIFEAYQQSGLTVDEFIVAYLRDKGIKNPEEVTAIIDSSFKKIDYNYEELKKYKSQGGDRKRFLRNICDETFKNTDEQKTGEALTVLLSGLNNDENPITDVPAYEDVDAVSYMNKLENAIKNNALADYMKEN